MTKKGKKNN